MNRNHFFAFLLVVFLIASGILAACAQGGTSSTSQPTASLPPATTASLPATQPPAATPPVTQALTPSVPVKSQTPGVNSPPVQAAVLALSRRLQVEPDAISLSSAEPVEWPDTCLGIQIQGEMCAQHVVPGFRIILVNDFNRYEYHTDLDGSTVRTEPAVSFTGKVGAIDETAAITYDQGITYGQLNSAQQTAPFPSDQQKADLANFALTYGPFAAETPVGEVHFAGMGDQEPSPSEQRMIAEWARLVIDEAAGGRAGAAYGLAFAWHEEGGIAGICRDLAVYVTGQVDITSCKGGQPTDLGRAYLDSQQLKQLYEWVDTLEHFEVNQGSPTNPDALIVHLIFDGNGSVAPTDAQKQAILGYAEQLFISESGTPSP